MTFARSLLFNLFFYVSTVLLCIPATVTAYMSPHRVMPWARLWARTQLRAAELICGIRLEVTGWQNLAGSQVLIASRHESTFDILVWLAALPSACFVVKQELTRIPLFGHCIRAVEMISIDRKAGGAAMRDLLRGGDRAKASGRCIVIFPEGTRAMPGQPLPLQPGIIALASRTGLPVVPVMTDSGRCWSNHSFQKRAGTIHVVIQPPLPKLSGREALLDALRVAFDPGKLASVHATAAS
jgi:1-acyl-sn-glycerol-3-phosphate acyltransferase